MCIWEVGSLKEVHLAKCLGVLLLGQPQLHSFLLDSNSFKLRTAKHNLLQEAKKFDVSQQIIVRLAIGFWVGKIDVSFEEVRKSLDFENFIQAIVSICLYEEIQSEVFESLSEFVFDIGGVCHFD